LLNRVHEETSQVFSRLAGDEKRELLPGDHFMIGSLQFEVNRFNIGIVNDIGSRPKMEDTYCVVQDLMLDPQVTISYFGVFDGHGGDSCPLFLK
jgi:hypothetical protein